MELKMQCKLKICGITCLEDALTAAALGVDWLGFNFYPESLRYIAPEAAAKIITELPDRIHSVGILVKPRFCDVEKIVQISHVQRVQIYEPQDFSDLSRFSVPAIMCYRVNESRPQDINWQLADMVLLDCFSSHSYGGFGKAFDWTTIPANLPREKLILAGGITSDNIQQALETVHPAVIDVATGAEISPGRKDPVKIATLLMIVREYNRKIETANHHEIS